MRLSGLYVEGFGALSDFGIEDLSPGLVILCGPNEAGKSTLLDFVTAMLFGFPARRDNPRFHAPVRGGRHGGRLTLAEGGGDLISGDGRLWNVERYGGSRKELRIRSSGPQPASEDDLRRALGGADESLFRAVFAVDLSDLGNAEAMERAEVRELLFSASIVGQRRSAARAMESLSKQRQELARPRKSDARLNRLLGELEGVRRGLAEANREVAGYPAREADLLGLEDEIASARDEADRADRRLRELDLLTRLWSVLERRRSAEQRLAAWQEPSALESWLEEQAPELEALRAGCSGHLERRAQLADLVNQRAGIDHSIQASLGLLGPDWDLDRIRSRDGWITLADQGRQFREALGDSEATWRTALALSEEADSAPELGAHTSASSPAAQEEAALLPDPSPEEQARQLGELRRNLAEQRRLTAELRAGERPSAGVSGGLGALVSGWPVPVLVLALVGAVLVAALAPGGPAVRLLCALLAAGCGLVAIAVAARRGQVAKPPEDDDLRAAHRRVSAKVRQLAAALCLPDVPSDSDVETAAENIEAARTFERTAAEDRRRSALAMERRTAAHKALHNASRELEAERARFAMWKLDHGFAALISPEAVLETLAALQAAAKDIAALARVDSAIEQRQAATADFEDRLTRLAAGLRERGCHGESLESNPESTLSELCSSLDKGLEKRAARAGLVEAADEAGRELELSLGLGTEAASLRAQLEAGEVLAWNEEGLAVEQDRSEARRRLEVAVRAHQDASNELGALASSDLIARLDQQRLSLEHEIDELLESWAVLGLARLLLQRTLRRHEQERQPAVLARAGERFSKVTEGRYTCLLPSVAGDGSRESIKVLSASGAEVDAGSLSRGTVEQLYLCLRLGLAETFAERATSLPIILDDVLVNFDPGRAASVAEALADTAERHQVLLFTCHPHIRDLVRTVAPEAQVIELDRL